MSGLFGGGPSQQAMPAPAPLPPPPPQPVLATPAPMPIPDKDEERRAALREMAIANAGKTTRANTIIGANDSNDDRLGG